MRNYMVLAGCICAAVGCEQSQPAVTDAGGAGDVHDAVDDVSAVDGDFTDLLDSDGVDDLPVGSSDVDADDAGEELPDLFVDVPPVDPCERSGAWSCSGFEGPALEPFDLEEFQGTVELSEEFVFRGSYSMKAELVGPGGFALVRQDVDPPIEEGQQVWMRFWAYHPGSNFNAGGIEFVRFDNGTHETLVLYMGEDEVDTHGHLPRESAFEFDHFEGFPEDRWVCVEWGFQLGVADASVELALDGVTIIREENRSIVGAAPFHEVRLGVVFAAENQYFFDLYFDEFFLGDFRPGCG